ncbi:MAG: GntR family transcriptional regulator [Acetobacteraceae bacterium]
MFRVEAYERFKQRILSGELKAGQFVTQRELAQLAAVPLAAAREAIQRLEFESLMKVFPQRGIQIADVSVGRIRDAYQLRLIYEEAAIRIFAEKASEALIDDLLERTAVAAEGSRHKLTPQLRARAVETDWAMHDTIVDHAGNSLLTEAYRINAARIRLIRVTNVVSDARLPEVFAEHAAILEACRERDITAALDALRRHIETSEDRARRGI